MKICVAGQGAFGIKHIEAVQKIPGIEIVTLAGGSADSERGVEVTVPAGASSSGIRPNSRSAASATSRLSSAVRRPSAFWAASDILGSLAAIRSRSVNAAAMRSRGASLFSCSWSEAGRIRIVGARMLWAITQSPTWLNADFVGVWAGDS